MNYVVDATSSNTVERMLMALAGVCNWAATLDGQGFSAFDAQFGHSLADRAAQGHAYSIKQAKAALVLVRKYQRQLGGKEFMDKFLENPVFAVAPIDPNAPNTSNTEVVPAKTDRQISSRTQNGVVVATIEFKFNRDLVDGVKSTFRSEYNGRKFWASWNGKCWTVPLNPISIKLLQKFAATHQFNVTDAFNNDIKTMISLVQEDHMMLTLNDRLNIKLAQDDLVIAIDDPVMMQQFNEVFAS